MEVAVSAIAGIVFNKFLEKSGEKLAEAFSNQAGGAIATIASQNPKAAEALTTGELSVIDAEVIEVVSQQAQDDPALQAMLTEMAAISDAEFAAEDLVKLKAVQTASQASDAIANVVASAITHRQVGLENFEAGELEGTIEQETPSTKPSVAVEQIGATGVKVAGKAVINIKQKIN